jgi:long-chain acyl-CoA synthetase
MENLYDIKPGEVFWAASDVGWVVGHSYIVYAPLLQGAATIVFEGKPVGTPDAGTFWRIIAEYGVSALFTAPTAFRAIKKEDPDGNFIRKYDLSSLRFAVSAAAPLAPEIQDRFQAVTGAKMLQAYGLTETSPCATMEPVERPKAHSIGVPLPDTTLTIVDLETGTRELPAGEIGEIIIKGPQVMKGYWNLPTETANALRTGPDGQPGWFFSGDIGHMDEEGYFHISDRKKDMIIAGGYNIYPADVEAVLFEHPKVKEAAVIGVPDERLGETVKAFVVLKSGETATEHEIIQFCHERMAAYRAPRQVEFRDDLPKSIIGKVLRRELRLHELGKG